MRIRTPAVLFLLLAIIVLCGVTPARAQQTQKRSEVEFLPVEPPAERVYRPWDPYNLSLMVEFGGQLVDVSGNNDVYRSHQNYRDGFRIFEFNVRGDGQEGAFFTDFYAEGTSWINEPYSFLRYGASKDKWFDFRSTFRESEYFWLFPGFARSQHFDNTERRLQDYRLTLFPGRAARLKLAYRRNSSFGPTLTTQDFSRDVFLLFEPVRQTYDEYTVGAEWNVERWLILGEFGYRFFRNDRFFTLRESPNPGNFFLSDTSSLFVYDRLYPGRGRIPFVTVNIVGRPHNTLEVNTRLVYSRPKTTFTRTEFREGTTFSSPSVASVPISEELFSFGRIIRPLTTVDGNVTWRPWRSFTVTNIFQFRGYNISGFQDEEITTTCGGPTSPSACDPGTEEELLSHLFDLDSFQERIEGRYDFNRWLGVRAGFSYLHRDFNFFEFEERVLEEGEGFSFINRSFLLGVNLRVHPRARLFFDLERGSNTRVFARTSPANIDRIRVRGRFEPWDGVRLNASWFIFDNSNFDLPIAGKTNAAHSARNRGFALDFQLARYQRGYVNLGYARNDYTTSTDVNLPGFGPPQTGVSLYILNSNYAYLDFGGRIAGNLYGDAGYRVVFDTGTFPPSNPIDPCNRFDFSDCENITGLSPLGVNRGGLNYHQPHASLRYVFSDNASWKAGWRWYGYNQKIGTFSDYKSHIVTTSVVLNF